MCYYIGAHAIEIETKQGWALTEVFGTRSTLVSFQRTVGLRGIRSLFRKVLTNTANGARCECRWTGDYVTCHTIQNQSNPSTEEDSIVGLHYHTAKSRISHQSMKPHEMNSPTLDPPRLLRNPVTSISLHWQQRLSQCASRSRPQNGTPRL